MKRFERARPLAVPITLCLAHVALLYALDATRVVGRLLVAVFFVLRLVVFFVVPGWFVLGLVAVARGPKARAAAAPPVSEKSP